MMFRLDGGKPGDARAFVHKKLLGLVSKVTSIIPSPVGQIVSGITGRLAGGGGGPPPPRPSVFSPFATRPISGTVPRTQTARPTRFSDAEKERGRSFKFPIEEIGGALGFGGPDDCPAGTVPDPRKRGFCVSPESPVGIAAGAGTQGVGNAVMGRYGAALEPGARVISRAVCLRGMQLGNDGLCYNRGQITNSQRMWPRGRRPLLTGGEMRAIGIAARAGTKVERTTKRLQKLGMIRKPAPRRALPAHAHAKPIGAVSVPN